MGDGGRGGEQKGEAVDSVSSLAFSTILPDLEEIRGGGEGRDK